MTFDYCLFVKSGNENIEIYKKQKIESSLLPSQRIYISNYFPINRN